MKFGYTSLIAAGLLAGGLGFGASTASAMPMGGVIAPTGDVAVHADKAAVLCLGGCFRRYGAYRPGFRAYRAYQPYAYRPYAFYGARPAGRFYRY